jgi:uncharacterized membrane protein
MSARNLRITLTVFTVAGLGIASYLTFIHYSGIKVICTAGESCTKVETSVYSELAGVPVALLGVLGYTTILGLLLAPENETTRFAMTAFTLVGFAFSAYLTYRELYSIHAICEWCATSAGILTLMAPLSVWRFLRGTASPSASGPTGPSLALRGLTAPARRSS